MELKVNDFYTVIEYAEEGEETLYKKLQYLGKVNKNDLFKTESGEYKIFENFYVVQDFKPMTVRDLIDLLSKTDLDKPVIVEMDNGRGNYLYSLDGAPIEVTQNERVVSISPENEYVVAQEY